MSQKIRRVKTIPGNSHQNKGRVAYEEENTKACQENADTCWIAQAVLGRCSQHSGVSDQRRPVVPLNCGILEKT